MFMLLSHLECWRLPNLSSPELQASSPGTLCPDGRNIAKPRRTAPASLWQLWATTTSWNSHSNLSLAPQGP